MNNYIKATVAFFIVCIITRIFGGGIEFAIAIMSVYILAESFES